MGIGLGVSDLFDNLSRFSTNNCTVGLATPTLQEKEKYYKIILYLTSLDKKLKNNTKNSPLDNEYRRCWCIDISDYPEGRTQVFALLALRNR